MAIINMEFAKDCTGGALSIKFIAGGPGPEFTFRRSKDAAQMSSFADVRRMVSQCSTRMEAFFRGLPPPRPVAAPGRKRKVSEAAAAEKKPRLARGQLLEEISAAEGTWLTKAVVRFQLKGLVGSVAESQWKDYFRERVLLEMKTQASTTAECPEALSEEVKEDASWPECLGERRQIHSFSFESYQARKARGLQAMTFQSSVAVAGLRPELWIEA